MTPFLFLCTVPFVSIMYWSLVRNDVTPSYTASPDTPGADPQGLNPAPAAFFRYIGFLFLGLYAAEAQVQLIATLIPIFIAALAITAFANGFWMSVGGYFIKYVSVSRRNTFAAALHDNVLVLLISCHIFGRQVESYVSSVYYLQADSAVAFADQVSFHWYDNHSTFTSRCSPSLTSIHLQDGI